nr:NT02FT0268 [synthetic construct]
MRTKNFENLYSDFTSIFDLCRYTNESLEEEIIRRVKEDNITEGMFLFRFRLVIFKFEVTNDSIEYIGYEK